MPGCNGLDRGDYLNTKVCPRPAGLSSQESLENHHDEETQMTAMALPLTGASSTCIESWDNIVWSTVEKHVRRLQIRIAKATREGCQGKVKALQWLLTHSFYAKLLAVKRVTQNQGRYTPGVDNIIWETPKQKRQAVRSLQRRGYQTQPLRRVYIPKKNHRQRPLGIPVMKDRAMQALHLQALEPIAETQADRNAYGFRPKRSTADAIEQCFKALANKHSAEWVLEADIKACFDQINHSWLRSNIPTDKKILSQWLKAGYIEQKVWFPTRQGTPQGGVISPALMNMTLDGLESVAKQAAPQQRHKVNTIRYADDFIVTGASKEVLERHVKPAVEAFLAERGLRLSTEKTHITHNSDGFDFLGFHLRKYGDKVLIKPAKQNVKALLSKVRGIIKSNPTAKTENLIRQLNPVLRGWAYYYRHVVAKQTFSYIDNAIFWTLQRWIKRRHPNKDCQWQKRRYYERRGLRDWIFSAIIRGPSGTQTREELFRLSEVSIQRHIKIKAAATPYDPMYRDYFEQHKQPWNRRR